MSLAFFDRKKAQAVAAGKSGTPLKPEFESDDGMRVLQALAQDMIAASRDGSASDFARAMKAFFLECDKRPHKEGPHE